MVGRSTQEFQGSNIILEKLAALLIKHDGDATLDYDISKDYKDWIGFRQVIFYYLS